MPGSVQPFLLLALFFCESFFRNRGDIPLIFYWPFSKAMSCAVVVYNNTDQLFNIYETQSYKKGTNIWALPNSASTTDWVSMANSEFLYHLDEASGATSFTDNSGNTRNASCAGGQCPTSGQIGKVSTAPIFDATDDRIDLSAHSAALSGISEGTISLWYKSSNKNETFGNLFSFAMSMYFSNG